MKRGKKKLNTQGLRPDRLQYLVLAQGKPISRVGEVAKIVNRLGENRKTFVEGEGRIIEGEKWREVEGEVGVDLRRKNRKLAGPTTLY